MVLQGGCYDVSWFYCGVAMVLTMVVAMGVARWTAMVLRV